MARKNKTRTALLGILSLGPKSGYDIKKFCDENFAFFWTENYAQIYPTLKQLEEEGLLCKETETRPGNPPRNVYYITDTGRAELNEWLLLPNDPMVFRSELLLKMRFSQDVPISNLIEKLEKARYVYQNDYQAFTERLIDLHLTEIAEHREKPDVHLVMAICKLAERMIKTSIEWYDETIEMLKERTSDSQDKG